MTDPSPPHIATAEEQKLYADFVAEANKRELSGSENFDKSVLTLSSAGLALSVSFLKDFAPVSGAAMLWGLYLSWGLFTTATVSTMASFLVSAEAQSYHRNVAYRAYILGEANAFEQRNPWGRCIPWLNVASAAAFTLALICTVSFIIWNLESIRMGTSNKIAPASSAAQRGAPVPTMQRPASAPATSPPQGAPTPAVPPSSPASAPAGS